MTSFPYIETMQDENYFKIIKLEFNIDNLVNYFKFLVINKQIGWNEIIVSTDNTKIKLFNNNDYYEIIKPSISTKYLLPYPKTLDEFICDCYRCLVDLQWNDEFVKKHDKKIFMKQDELETYFDDLLIKIDKK